MARAKIVCWPAVAAGGAALLALACTPHTSNAPTPERPSAPAATTTAGTAATAASARPAPAAATSRPGGPLLLPPRYVTGHLVYEITSIGTVETVGDTSGRADTINTVTKLSYDARWSGSDVRLTGDVRAQVTGASPGLRAANQAAPQPATFDATIDSATGSVVFAQAVQQSGTQAECPTAGPAVDQARQVATERPRSFEAGATWQDTLVDKTCLSGVPLVTHAVRVYQVSAEPATDPYGAPAVLVSHTSEASMIGGGQHTGRQITLNGKGSGNTEQYYDRATGVMLSAHTVAALDLDVGEAGRVQRLRQHADWNAKLENYVATAP